MRKKRPISRTESHHRDTSLVVIASEDRYAVKQYFELFRSTRIQFHVLETEKGDSSPVHVMKRLEDYLEEYAIGDEDQFWLVCDTDHWIEQNHTQNLVEVVRLCKQKGISAAISNPCFDLWLLLHFDEFPSGSDLSCVYVGSLIRDKIGAYNKTKVFSLPFTKDSVKDAIRRSSANFAETEFIPVKPQTAIHLIIQELVERQIVTIVR